MTSAAESVAFAFRGRYRVQSTRTAYPSALRGTWCAEDSAIAAAIDRTFRRHPLRSARKTVTLRTASVAERAGTFARCPDVLYKRDLFVAEPGTPAFDTNIVDVDKAIRRWHAVEGTLDAVWGPRAADIVAAVRDPGQAVRREYFAHEAGHLIGVDVDEKAASGYFRPGGDLRWPLVYLEEVRADLHALALAADAYAPADASAVFHYHAATRFGMHHPVTDAATAPFGLVPFLLFVALRGVNLIDVVRTDGLDHFTLTTRDVDRIVEGMRACGSWISERVTAPELDAASPLDMALAGASFVRACRDDAGAVAAFSGVAGRP